MPASRKSRLTGIALSSGPAVLTSLAADWYAAPWGTPGGNGSFNNPWDLQTALDPSLQPLPPGRVQAGDTVWLRGGVYVPQQTCGDGLFNFCCRLQGTQAQPTVVRGYPSDAQRPTIDGGVRQGNIAIIHVRNSYVHFREFEIMSSALDHSAVCGCCPPPCPPCSSLPSDIEPAMAFHVHSDPNEPVVGLKFINLVIHDTATPFYLHENSDGAEVYGCMIYYNGWHTVCESGAWERGHGHGIYMENDDATPKKAVDNIVFGQFGSGIVGYSVSVGQLNDIHVEGNIVFNNGVLTTLFERYEYGYQDNIGVGDAPPPVEAVDPVLLNNYSYFTPAGFEGGRSGGRSQLGHAGTSVNAVATGNYFVAQDGRCLLFLAPNSSDPNAVIQNNVFYGSTCSDKDEEWDTLGPYRGWQHNNSFFQAAPTLCYPDPPVPPLPTGVQSFVRPNLYEPGRGHVVVYNWENDPNVPVDVSSVLQPGDTYILLDVQNYFGLPVKSGVYGGATISIPMPNENAPLSIPWGTPDRAPPKHTPRQFGAFVIIRTGSIPHENGPLPE